MDTIKTQDAPIVVELGAASRKRIRQLKCGTGKLDAEIKEVITRVREHLGADAANTELVPVVVVYSRKRKRSRSFIDLLL